MKLSHLLILLLLAVFVQCDNTPNFDKGPCKFAPPESNFTIFSGACEECFFNLIFDDKEYHFAGNQFEDEGGGPGWAPERNILVQSKHNAFLSFYLVSPASEELLNNSIGIKTPLLESASIANLDGPPPPVTASLGIFNYCKVFFEPITGDVNQSHHLITETEHIQSSYMGSIDGSIEKYQKHIYYCFGEIHSIFMINGEERSVVANYKIKMEIWEEL